MGIVANPIGFDDEKALRTPNRVLQRNTGSTRNSPKVQSDVMDSSLLDMESDAVFRVRGVTKIYPMGEVSVHALRGVDLDLYAGEFVVILGASGSGKSTLLNILGGLDVPTAGSVYFRDHDLTRADEDERTYYRRDHVGFVFQFYNLIAGLTAYENVALVADIAKAPLPPIEALRLVGLEERKDHYPSQLSGGEQQRIAIARAIGKRPDVLLCDEPTGALDVKTGVIVLDAIANVNRQLGTLTVVITHNASIAQMADRVISMKDGRISAIERNSNQIPASQLVW
ncbi:MAG: ABC transporter ATP-binding protein [Pirellula sp.]|nr:ABC transporter ATP-binding protein [Pirellula sp.]